MDVAARLLHVSSESDMSEGDHAFVRDLRTFHDVLLLDEEAPMADYLQRLRELRDLGILNLHLVVVGPRNTPYHSIQYEKRSLTSKLRESTRREKSLRGRLDSQLEQSKRREEECKEQLHAERRSNAKRAAQLRKKLKAERLSNAKSEARLRKELSKTKRALEQAEKNVAVFVQTHPDWKEPDSHELNRQDSRDFYNAFQDVDRHLDVELQMKHDPSGLLTTWWAEQRRRLRVNKRAKWNPEVLRYCFLFWNQLGNKNYKRLQGVLILPDIRSMQRYKKNYVGSGSGYQKEMFVKVAKILGSQAKSVDDSEWTVNLSWHATGYAKRILFNKHTGALLGGTRRRRREFQHEPRGFQQGELT